MRAPSSATFILANSKDEWRGEDSFTEEPGGCICDLVFGVLQSHHQYNPQLLSSRVFANLLKHLLDSEGRVLFLLRAACPHTKHNINEKTNESELMDLFVNELFAS
ncbi:hypothetical protein Tcan_09742 [Toxocara canis]|uniref:Uncharacterized protein n=1 Tax=Toxocara canis TaxID=6265 RepID=A0A0B2VG20_TOXCA|nr:hypothetical protein Tcan_09742 [Toxocara canis]